MLPISSSRPVQLMGRMARSFPEGLPDATIVHRIGEIKAWDNADFVAAVKKTGRKKLLVAGISTEVCVAFVAHHPRSIQPSSSTEKRCDHRDECLSTEAVWRQVS